MITGDNWNAVVQPYVYSHGWGVTLYFVSLILFGNLMLLNLFLAILLNYISENLDEEVVVQAQVEERAS